jgi:hypothetical protein
VVARRGDRHAATATLNVAGPREALPPYRGRALRVPAALAGVAAALVLTGALAAGGWPSDAYWRGDHLVFWAGSRAVLSGVSPYDPAWWDALPEREGRPAIELPYRPRGGATVTTSYPLWTFVVFAPFGALPFETAAAAWLVAQLLVVSAGLVVLSLALFDQPRRDVPVGLGIAAGFEPTWILAGNGNITGFVFGALAGGLRALLAEHPYAAGLLLGLLALKPHSFALLPAVVLVGARHRARVVAGALTTVAALLAAALAVRPGWIAEWLPQVAAAGSAGLSSSTAFALDRVTGASLAPALAIVVALAAFVAWWSLRRPAFDVLFAGALAISLFVAPYGWSYDQLHLLVVALVIIRLLASAPRVRTAGLVLLAVIAGPLPWLLYATAFVRGGEELTALVPVLFFALLVVTERWARADRRPSAPAAQRR